MNNPDSSKRRLPTWLKRPMPKGEAFSHVISILKEKKLNTVCASAACPNQGECYSCGTATFMIMGDTCSRNCAFCNVNHGNLPPLAEDEPQRLAEAVVALSLKHVVVTSVTRDDLPDGGAAHFARTISAVRNAAPQVTIEVLTPDFQGHTRDLDIVAVAGPDVFNHNIETTRRLTPEIRSGADYDRSLAVLNYMANHQVTMTIKSGFMLGLGEWDSEIDEMITDLHAVGVQMLTIGQYLRPNTSNREVQKFYTPEEFQAIEARARQYPFKHVAAGPFVRSSYHAELSLKSHL